MPVSHLITQLLRSRYVLVRNGDADKIIAYLRQEHLPFRVSHKFIPDTGWHTVIET